MTCTVEIIGLKEEKEYLDKYILKIVTCTEIPESNNKKFIAYIEKGNEYKPGDIIRLNGVIKKATEARNFFGFNQRNYLKQSKIYGIIDVHESEYIKTIKDLNYILGVIQTSLKSKVQNLYSDSYASTINKILFGMNEDIDEDITSNFRDAGISHVLAISGLHITYVIMILNYIFQKLITNIKIRNLCVCIVLIIFLLITGASPSCTRACIMNILYLIAQNVYRKSNIYISICFAFCVLLFSNMYVVYNIGMWLSFLGTLGIVLFHPFLSRILKLKKDKFSHKIVDIILVSISAQILLWPVVLYYFNTISFTFFISNICISILLGPSIILGYFSIIASYFIFPIAEFIAMVEELFLQLLFYIADICSKIPFSKIYIKGTNIWILVMYYTLIFFIVFYYLKNKIDVLRKIIIIKNVFCLKEKAIYKIKSKITSFILSDDQGKKRKILLCITLFIFVFVFIIKIFKYQELKLYFVDVGQGDCTIIQVEGKNMIIDSGEGNSESYDYGKNVVFQHLLKLGINKLDYIIYSHMDSDHAGGLMYILENMEVKEVLIGIQTEESYQLNTLLKIVQEKNIKVTILEADMKVKISNSSFIEVLWPIKNELIKENPLNNNSLVFKLYYNDFSILFTGDIEEVAEDRIAEKYKVRLKCDILKVAHHGSKTSTIQVFLEYVKPKIALIGVGKDNKFKHPSDSIIERLNKISCKIFRTDLNGEIILKIRKHKIFIKTKLK